MCYGNNSWDGYKKFPQEGEAYVGDIGICYIVGLYDEYSTSCMNLEEVEFYQ